MKLENKSKAQLIGEIKSLQKQLEKLKNDQEQSKAHRTDGTGKLSDSIRETKLPNEQFRQEVQERIQAEEALRESEQSLRALLNAITDATSLMDPDGTLIAVNEATTKVLSKRIDVVIGRNVYDLLPPHLAESRKTKAQQVIRSGKSIRFQDQHADQWLDNSIYPVFDTAGKVVRLAIFGRDITEQKRAEKELKEAYENLQDFLSIINRSPIIVFLWRMAKGWPVDFASENVKRLGYTAKDFTSGKVSWPGITHPDDGPRLEKEVANYLDQGIEEWSQEYRLITKTGDIKWATDWSKIIRDADGNVTHIQGIILDITDRKRAEEALRSSEQKFFKAYHSSPSIMAITTLKEGRFIDVNESFSRITGYTRDEVIGRTSTELKLYTENGNRERLMRILKKEGIIRNIAIGVHTKSGEVRLGLFSAEPVQIDNDQCLLTVLDDITEKKQAVIALKESEERYRTLITQMLNAFALHEIICDKKGKPCDYRFLEVNPSFEKMTELKAHDIIGKTALNVLPKLESYWIETYGKVALTQKPVHFENYSREFDKYFEVLAYSPQEGQFATVFTDITDRKVVEEKLQFTQFSVDHAGEAAFWMEPDARFIYVNEEACRSLGYKREELLSMTVHDIDPDFPKEIWEDHWKEIKQKGTFTLESHHRTKDGIVFPVEITVNYLEFKGREYNCAFARDITVRKQTDEALKRYTETQAVLLREVNHRVKNNLSAIISMLHKEGDRARKDKVTSHLPVLQSLEGRIRGLSTVHSILSASEWQPLKLTELCNQVIRAGIQTVPSTKKIDLEISSSNIKVNSNQAHHLTLVINELLTNTIKHVLRDRESVTIGVRVHKQKEEVKICFYDDGPGFPPSMPRGDFSKSGVGFDLIRGIVRKNLKGNIRLMNRLGARVYIQFQHE